MLPRLATHRAARERSDDQTQVAASREADHLETCWFCEERQRDLRSTLLMPVV